MLSSSANDVGDNDDDDEPAEDGSDNDGHEPIVFDVFGAILYGAKVFVCQIKRLKGHVGYFNVPIRRRVDPMFVHALKNTLDFSDNTLHNLFNLFSTKRTLSNILNICV